MGLDLKTLGVFRVSLEPGGHVVIWPIFYLEIDI